MMFTLQFALAVLLLIFGQTSSFYNSALFHTRYNQLAKSFNVRSNSIRIHNLRIDANYYESLKQKTWIKLICGASNQDVTFIRNLCFVYTLSGVDCIDISADTAVITAARNGIDSALNYNIQHDRMYGTLHQPLLMVSVNDDEDPHFRKAYFNKTLCPSDCPRPCERVCPADAIPPTNDSRYKSSQDGVIFSNCYGCGRCLNVCPLGLIEANYYEISPAKINEIFRSGLVDSIEIHTLAGHEEKFRSLVANIDCELFARAKLIAISFPKINNKINDTVAYISKLESILTESPNYNKFHGLHIWQTDGKPMTGDIGRGSARAAAEFASDFIDHIESDHLTKRSNIGSLYSLLDHGNRFIQLAGGTNDFSHHYAKEYGLHNKIGFGGFAFGGYARKHINSILEGLEKKSIDILSEAMNGSDEIVNERKRALCIEDYPQEFQQCMRFAAELIQPVKSTGH